jgi:hypothetical protein
MLQVRLKTCRERPVTPPERGLFHNLAFHPPGRTDKNLCRCVSPPARRFPSLITLAERSPSRCLLLVDRDEGSLSHDCRGGEGESQDYGGERAGWPGGRRRASRRRVGGAGSLPQTKGCLDAQEILACEGGRNALRPTGTAASRHARPAAKLIPRACRPQGPSTSCAPSPSPNSQVN